VPYRPCDRGREEDVEKEEELKEMEDKKKVINLITKNPKQVLKGNRSGKMLYVRYKRNEKSAKRMRTEQTQVVQWTRQLDPFIRKFFNEELIPEASKRLKVTVKGCDQKLKIKFMNQLRKGVPNAVRHAVPSKGDCGVGEWGIRRTKRKASSCLEQCVETTAEYKYKRKRTKRTF